MRVHDVRDGCLLFIGRLAVEDLLSDRQYLPDYIKIAIVPEIIRTGTHEPYVGIVNEGADKLFVCGVHGSDDCRSRFNSACPWTGTLVPSRPRQS